MRELPPSIRQTGLLIVAFIATLALLGGGLVLLRQGPADDTGRPPPTPPSGSTPVAVASPSSSRVPGLPTTGPNGSSPPTIVLTGAGDIANCALPGAAGTANILAGQAGGIFTAGDNAYPDGSAANFAACYDPTWGRVKDRTILPAPGNHDWQTPGAAGYLGYFGTVAGPGGVTWYSLDLGAWHVIVLDSDCVLVGGCDGASPQGRWLARDLADSQARCTLAIWHQPRFSSGDHGNDPEVGPFWDLLHAAGAELIVNGHDHDYERFAPQDPSGKVERPGGLREIVVGTGGAELRPFHVQAANSEFRQAGTYGVLRLTLHPANYDWEFLPVGSDVADAGSTPCH